jgi:hypothetical protein
MVDGPPPFQGKAKNGETYIIWNPKVYYRVLMNLLLLASLRQFDPDEIIA